MNIIKGLLVIAIALLFTGSAVAQKSVSYTKGYWSWSPYGVLNTFDSTKTDSTNVIDITPFKGQTITLTTNFTEGTTTSDTLTFTIKGYRDYYTKAVAIDTISGVLKGIKQNTLTLSGVYDFIYIQVSGIKPVSTGRSVRWYITAPFATDFPHEAFLALPSK